MNNYYFHNHLVSFFLNYTFIYFIQLSGHYSFEISTVISILFILFLTYLSIKLHVTLESAIFARNYCYFFIFVHLSLFRFFGILTGKESVSSIFFLLRSLSVIVFVLALKIDSNFLIHFFVLLNMCYNFSFFTLVFFCISCYVITLFDHLEKLLRINSD